MLTHKVSPKTNRTAHFKHRPTNQTDSTKSMQ